MGNLFRLRLCEDEITFKLVRSGKVSGKSRLRSDAQTPNSLNSAMAATALPQILLVIFLCSPEWRRRLDARHNRARKSTAVLQPFFCRFSRGFLFRRMIENYRPILGPYIRTLSVQRRWIVVRPENVQQLFVADLGRIILQLDHLSVSSFVSAHVLVGRVLLFTACVPDCSGSHSF
jgi:hypothetical protein